MRISYFEILTAQSSPSKGRCNCNIEICEEKQGISQTCLRCNTGESNIADAGSWEERCKVAVCCAYSRIHFTYNSLWQCAHTDVPSLPILIYKNKTKLNLVWLFIY